MMILKYSFAALFVIIPLASAQASGYIPMPDNHETLPSFRACLARLEAAKAGDAKTVQPRTVAADGSTSEVAVESRSSGIERNGKKKARYHGRIWYAHGRIAAHDAAQREVSHSWQEQELLCDGRKLTIKSAQGYTLSSFEPIVAEQEK